MTTTALTPTPPLACTRARCEKQYIERTMKKNIKKTKKERRETGFEETHHSTEVEWEKKISHALRFRADGGWMTDEI